MKLPISWLRQWVEFDATPAQVAEALTTRGFYVEGVEEHGRRYPGIVVARVLETEKHPNADKLKLCRVDGGAGELRIVCGAPNVAPGMVVALATLGTTMPNGLVIKAAKIRGEESQGMLCSARELLMSEEHAGILDLRETLAGAELVPGRALDSYLPEPDAVLEVEVPFNRPDGMGVVGLAREVKAALGGRWTPTAHKRLAAKPAVPGGFDLALEDRDGCPSYLGQVVTGVTIGPSPTWLVRQLEAMGQRSINNVVDLTNLVLFEFGQPVHAFDLDTLAGPAIVVRRAKAGEKLVTLDGKERELNPEVLLICDAKRPVALAGVMGGADAEVTDGTKNLLLECAWFRPQRIRRSARSLDHSTEASKRYERGVDPGIADAAAARFLSLIVELCPGAQLGPGTWLRERPVAPTLSLRPSRCERLIGLPFTASRCTHLLEALEFDVKAQGDVLRVTVPSWRLDVSLEDDLVEEIARSHGYDLIPDAPLETGGAFATRTPRERTVRRAREAMLARGLHEAWCSSMVGEREALNAVALLGDEPRLVRLANPMSRESEVMRPNLLPGLLRAVAHNLRQGASAVRLFEVGVGIQWKPGQDPAGGELPVESLMVAAVVAGPRWSQAHDASQVPVDFLEAKGTWEAWLDEMRVDDPTWRSYAAAGWKPGASAEVAVGTSRVGWAGQLAPSFLRSWDIEVPVHAFVALLEPLAGAGPRQRASLPGRFPAVRRDLAFFVPRTVTHAQMVLSLTGVSGELLRSIELFDIYEGPGTPAGMKSLAYALQFQSAERTLAESEVETLQERMVAAVARECGGQLREKA